MSRRNTGQKSPWMTAQLTGAVTYSTGKPCKRGHVTVRRAHNGMCIDCEKVGSLSRRKPEGYIARRAQSPGN